MKKQIYVLTIVFCIVSMLSFPASAPPTIVSAEDLSEGQAFVPLVSAREPILFDDFSDASDPVWTVSLLKDPKDGFFEHMNGKYLGHIRDNSAMIVSSPGWRPRGDFKLEVEGRHLEPPNKTFNALGLAFSGDDEWKGYYALMIAAGAAQHFWAVVRFENTRAKYLTNHGYRGGPGSMKPYSGPNRLMVVRIGDTIKPYCNGRGLPVGDGRPYVVDNSYGPGRLVGLVVTSYEFDEGEVDFDNFKLTPLYGEDPDEYRPEGYESDFAEYQPEGQTGGPDELDAQPLDLH